jgi:hypothetical protein
MSEILSMLSAKGAPFNQAWGNAPVFVEISTSTLKARFSEFFQQSDCESRFQRSSTRS